MKKNNFAQIYCYLVMFASTVMLSMGLVMMLQFGLKFLPDGKYKLDYWAMSRCEQNFGMPMDAGFNKELCEKSMEIERENRKMGDLVNNLSILLVGAGMLGGHYWVLKKISKN